MEKQEDKKQNNRKLDEKINPDSVNNAASNEKEWDPKNDPDEGWGNDDEDNSDDSEKKKEKDPDEKVEY